MRYEITVYIEVEADSPLEATALVGDQLDTAGLDVAPFHGFSTGTYREVFPEEAPK